MYECNNIHSNNDSAPAARNKPARRPRRLCILYARAIGYPFHIQHRNPNTRSWFDNTSLPSCATSFHFHLAL